MRSAIWVAILFGFVGSPTPLWAQTTSDRMGTGLEPATVKDLKHGQQVEITANNKKVSGTFVRMDGANARLFIRTEPGALPQAIAAKDVTKIERKVQFALSKDNVKLVGTESQVGTPEIQVLEIVNGTKRTVRYSGPTLSSGEQSMLANLESAENELAQMEYQAGRQEQIFDNALAIQNEQRRTQELLTRYQLTANQILRGEDPQTGLPLRVVYGYNYGGYGYNYNYFGNMYPSAQPWAGGLLQQYPVIPTPVAQSPIVTPQLPAPMPALAKMRQDVTAMHRNVVFEQNRLVAVVVDK
jgi:hypothetical protein